MDFAPYFIIRFNAATLTLKNSSRLLEKMPRNFRRSRMGIDESAASCKTLALKLSQLMSLGIRFILFLVFTICVKIMLGPLIVY
jgi:hypothetical protein